MAADRTGKIMRFGKMSRREFARLSAGALACADPLQLWAGARAPGAAAPLTEFDYGNVTLHSAVHEAQLANTHEVLMNLNEDSLLKPFRRMAGQAAPGADLGGWYDFNPDYDFRKDDDAFAPGATFGQWMSALARHYAISGSPETRDKILRLNRGYAAAISADFYDKNRFPAYCYDKLVLGLIDSHQFAGDRDAFAILERTTDAALPHMPGRAVDRELEWRPGKDQSFRWDESYTNPENLFIAYQRGAGGRYRDIAVQYLDDATWFDPLSRGENVLATKHAYSYVNSLSSAMLAFWVLGSDKHLHAAKNGFDMVTAESFATGGWGPDEQLAGLNRNAIFASLSKTHHSFETPCGAYAHFKVARYLLRATGDALYGDSMERMMYNTVLGAKPMQADGRAFYYADYNFSARKLYSNHRFPCCSGTLPQVAADYRINTYLRDRRGVYVNLYIPSTLRWIEAGVPCTLTQASDYPFDDVVTLGVQTSRPQEFALRLRIPAWAQAARVSVNGQRWRDSPAPGTFAEIFRRWRTGDTVELELPRKLSLEPLDAAHPNTVALVCGPLVLFAIAGDSELPNLTRQQLLAATAADKSSWVVHSGSRAVAFLPFVAIDQEQYSTYLQVG